MLHHRDRFSCRGAVHACPGELVAVVTVHAPARAGGERRRPRRGHPDLGRHAHRVGCGRRLDDPRERLDLDDLPTLRSHDLHRLRTRGRRYLPEQPGLGRGSRAPTSHSRQSIVVTSVQFTGPHPGGHPERGTNPDRWSSTSSRWSSTGAGLPRSVQILALPRDKVRTERVHDQESRRRRHTTIGMVQAPAFVTQGRRQTVAATDW
ncbi:hypothetical protein GALL_246770 [mine drainage metagenome]|uniref:Uncharacterized protein n=1 Tax=mine drainage metagenome TaxID=410659 RepID=A0A1J5RV59_9ZZZZ